MIEEDDEVRELVGRALARAGFDVTLLAHAGGSALDADYDLVVVDSPLAHADIDGLRRFCERPETAVIVLTAGAASDRVHAFEIGADDCVGKPFSSDEFVARVRSVLRRTSRRVPLLLEYGELVIDPTAREVRVAGRPVDLTARQFELLLRLAENPGRVFTREELLHAVWGSSSEWQSSATVTEHVHRIRQRIEEDPRRPSRLVTVRGVGYRFNSTGAEPMGRLRSS